jgi:hypothetical protein
MIFFAISVLFGRVSKLSVETINLQLFFGYLNVTFFYQSLLITNFSLLIFKLADKLIQFLLEKFVLALGV